MIPLLSLFGALARYWVRHKVQALLSLTGVVVGVAVFSAIRLANLSALESFSDGVAAFAGRATHRVFSPADAGVPDSVFSLLATSGAARAATPYLESTLRIQHGGTELPITLVGFDFFTEGPFRRLALGDRGDAAPPATISPAFAQERFFTERGAIMISAALAQRLAVGEGATLAARMDGQTKTLRVVGIFQVAPDKRLAFARTAIADVATYQELLGRAGKLDAIHLIVEAGRERQLAALLPPGLTMEAVGRRGERVAAMAEAFQLNLEALGLFALLVAAFVIFNAAAFSVLQRSTAIAVLRSIGATRGAIFFGLLLEGAVLGMLGGVLGVLAGQGLAAVMLRFTSATLFEIILGGAAREVEVVADWPTWAAGLGLGITVSVLGMAWPAIEGSRVSPMDALRRAGRTRRHTRLVVLWSAFGALTLVLAAALTLPKEGSLAAGLAGAGAVAVGFAALCPLALLAISRASTPLLGVLFGPAGRLAGSNLGRSLARSGLAAGSLMVALALALSIEITVKSFRRTFDIWLSQALTADLYIDTRQRDAVIPAETLRLLRAQPWVREFAVLRARHVILGDRRVMVLAMDGHIMPRVARLPLVSGNRATAFAELRAGRIFVSESLARALSLGPGGSLRLPTPGGPRALPIAAVVRNYTHQAGVVYLEQEHYLRLFGAQPIRQAAVWVKPNTDSQRAVGAIESLPGGLELRISPNGEIRREAMRVFDRTFAITDLMGSLAAVVAFFAVVSALTAMLEERMRLLGTLRAIGISRARLALSLAVEASLLALAATVVSWGAGVLMSAVLIFVVNPRAFGWSLQFHPLEGAYFSLGAIAIGAALLGSIYPILRATRLSPAATIREE